MTSFASVNSSWQKVIVAAIFTGVWRKQRSEREREKSFLADMNSLADLYPAAIGRQHPYGYFQPLPGLVDDRHRTISPLWLAQDLNGGTMERVERIEDMDPSVSALRVLWAWVSSSPCPLCRPRGRTRA